MFHRWQSFGVRHSAAVSPLERRTVLLPGDLAGAWYRAEYRVSTCPLVHADRSRIVWGEGLSDIGGETGDPEKRRDRQRGRPMSPIQNSREWVHGPAHRPFNL